MTEQRRQIATLLAWCELNDFDIHSQLKLDWDPDTGIGIYSKGSYIPLHTKLVRIPGYAVLSTKSCTLSEYIPSSPYGIHAQLALSLALYTEVLRGKFSRWFGYLQSLDQNVVDIPVFWDLETGISDLSCRRLEDGREALQWLRGTEAERILQKQSENGRVLIEELNSFYCEIAEPLILGHADKISNQFTTMPTLHGFYRAYSLVSSRAFIVDAYHGLCMVPIADAFNHELQNHVHLESDYHVCPECGSLPECRHDREDTMSVPIINSTTAPRRAIMVDHEEQENDYFMVSITAIPPGVKVFNTYGETLTNAELLAQYGFILEANDNDVLTWDMDRILNLFAYSLNKPLTEGGVEALLQPWEELCQLDWEMVSASSLVYLHGSAEERSLTLNGDGKISHQLWLFAALLSCNQFLGKPYERDPVVIHLYDLLNVQFSLEEYLDMENEPLGQASPRIDGDEFDVALVRELEQLCEVMMRLCADREAKTGLAGLSDTGSDVGEYFDVLPKDRTRSRMAVSLVLNELALLNNCRATWTELRDVVKLIKIGN